MGRTKNTVESVRFEITTTRRVLEDLEALAATEYYGKNRNEAAEEILRTHLRQLISSGELDRLRRARRTKRRTTKH